MTGRGESDVAGATPPEFDPRHDAIFQRGYRPGHPAGSSRAPERPELVGAPPTSPAAAPVDFDEMLGGVPGPAADGDDISEEPEDPAGNPFIALLWVLAVVLPAGGMVLQWQAVSGMFRNNGYSGNEPPVSLVLQQFSYLVAPPLISAGIVILGGLLFWHAWAWRARRLRIDQRS